MQIIGDRVIMQDGTEYRVNNGMIGVSREEHRVELAAYMVQLIQHGEGARALECDPVASEKEVGER